MTVHTQRRAKTEFLIFHIFLPLGHRQFSRPSLCGDWGLYFVVGHCQKEPEGNKTSWALLNELKQRQLKNQERWKPAFFFPFRSCLLEHDCGPRWTPPLEIRITAVCSTSIKCSTVLQEPTHACRQRKELWGFVCATQAATTSVL